MAIDGGESDLIVRSLAIPGVRSIIVIGSRARGKARPDSDYDIYVVVPALAIPFIYPRLMKRQAELEAALGNHVCVSPLSIRRILRGNDLLLYKTKREGMTLWGADYRPAIAPGSIADVPDSEFYTYLFSAARFLAESRGASCGTGDREGAVRLIAKSITYCREVLLYLDGREAGDDLDAGQAMSALGPSRERAAAMGVAERIIEGEAPPVDDAAAFWRSARDLVVALFVHMMRRDKKNEGTPVWGLVDRYVETGSPIVKNLQYEAGVLFYMHRPPIFDIFRRPAEKYHYGALLYLLLAAGGDGFDRACLARSMDLLRKIDVRLDPCGDDAATWSMIEATIIAYWPISAQKSII